MQEINLYRLLQFYVKKWYVIVLLSIFGFAAGYAYTHYLQTPLYKSDATLILISENGSTPHDPTLINNYVELFTSRKVLDTVITNLDLDTSYSELATAVEASNEKDTEVIKISVATESPTTSTQVADEAIATFKDEVSNLYHEDNIEVVDGASVPEEPHNVRPTMQLALATAAGFFLSTLVLFFVYDFQLTKRELQNDRIVPARPAPLSRREETTTAAAAPASSPAPAQKPLLRRIMIWLVEITVGTHPDPRSSRTVTPPQHRDPHQDTDM